MDSIAFDEMVSFCFLKHAALFHNDINGTRIRSSVEYEL